MFRGPNAPQPANKRTLIGPNLLVLPKILEVARATDSAPDDTRQSIFFINATIDTQVNKMTSYHVGRYFLYSRTRILAVDDALECCDPYVQAKHTITDGCCTLT